MATVRDSGPVAHDVESNCVCASNCWQEQETKLLVATGSTQSAIMTTQAANWATPDDLEAHRDLITQLYLVQNRPLKQVVEIMRDRYGINAT